MPGRRRQDWPWPRRPQHVPAGLDRLFANTFTQENICVVEILETQ
jgi:hypothetical protein